jgi:bacillithiol biosynthesis deacetylase BshB1
MKLDVLAFGAHPDDVEISCAGTMVRLAREGKATGIIDLTRGELGTRGTPETRATEAVAAAEVMGLSVRENMGLPDGFFQDTPENQLKVIGYLRKYRPSMVLCNSVTDRHPDHGRASAMVLQSCFLSGLVKIDNGMEPWRPNVVLHYIQDDYQRPDIILDVTDYFDLKMKAMLCYTTQFNAPAGSGPTTPISTPEFLEMLRGRSAQLGRYIGTKYAEGFTCARPLGVKNLTDLL